MSCRRGSMALTPSAPSFSSPLPPPPSSSAAPLCCCGRRHRRPVQLHTERKHREFLRLSAKTEGAVDYKTLLELRSVPLQRGQKGAESTEFAHRGAGIGLGREDQRDQPPGISDGQQDLLLLKSFKCDLLLHLQLNPPQASPQSCDPPLIPRF